MPFSASSCCCAGGSTYTAARCWRSTESASRRSTTKITSSPALHYQSPSAARTPRLEDYLTGLDEGDMEDGATGGGARTKARKIAALREKRGRYQTMLAQLERTGDDQISLTDPNRVDSDVRCNPVDSIGSSTESRVSHSEPRLLLGFQGTKTARREGKSSPFSDAGCCTSRQNSGPRASASQRDAG